VVFWISKLKGYNEHIDDLIALVLAGEADHAAVTELQAWIALDPANEAYFGQMKSLMDKSAVDWDPSTIDVDAAWDRVSSKTFSENQVIPIKRFVIFSWKYAAAALLAGLIVVVVLLNQRSTKVELAIRTSNEIVRDTIDGDLLATVNKNSELTVLVHEKTGKRTAKLNGEAHFEVNHNPGKSLIVETQNLLIEDIGTVFNVSSYEKSDSVVVAVSEGVVKFYSASNKGIEIHAGEVGVFRKSTSEFVKSSREGSDLENISGYADRKFRFRNTPVRKVIERLNEVYSEKLILSDAAMGDCRISASFDNEELDVVVGVIAESMGWQVSLQGKVYTFSGPGCDD
jgi:transmembrane sensor